MSARQVADQIVAEVAQDDLPIPGPANPMAVARLLMLGRTQDDIRTLRRWRGGWMSYLGTHWAEIEQAEVSAWLYEKLEQATYLHVTETVKLGKVEEVRPWLPNKAKVANVFDALNAVTHLPERVSPPSWPDRPSSAPAGQLVACLNGLLEITGGTLHPHTPAYFNQVAVPFDYAPDAPEPTDWLAFLDQLWPDDADSIMCLQEWYGYVLSGRTDLQKILLMIGPIRCGKGTIAGVLEKLVGLGNHTGPTMASLATNFGLAPLIGVPLAVVSDARASAKFDSGPVVERLLSISGEDTLTVDRKNRECWVGRLPSRIMILSNMLPRLGDASGAIAKRFVTLSLTRSFEGEEDLTLKGRLHAELPGILNWALEGLRRLTEQGRFTVPAASQDDVDALADLVSPTRAFVAEMCTLSGEVSVDGLFDAWRVWAGRNGHHLGSKQSFGRDLRSAVPGLNPTRPRTNGDRYRAYVGLSLGKQPSGGALGPDGSAVVRGPNTYREVLEVPERLQTLLQMGETPAKTPKYLSQVENHADQGDHRGPGAPPLGELRDGNDQERLVNGHPLTMTAYEFCTQEGDSE